MSSASRSSGVTIAHTISDSALGWSGHLHPERAAVRKLALIGNHLPRQCGIATFTTDLVDAITSVTSIECRVLAMNEPGQRYDYPRRVAFGIEESDVASYRRAADYLSISGVDVVSIQHEYGIFGGKAGVLLLDVMREIRVPIVSTLHTILAEPNPAQRAVLDEVARLSTRIVVMSRDGAKLLEDVHGVDARKIDVIAHGIPRLPRATLGKDKLGVEGNDVILTFGLLSPDKGIEYVVDALPQIVRERPNAIYVVVGVTHPHVKEKDGEAYRLMLEHRAKRLGVSANIIFHDRFVSQEELVEFLAAADIYITPYLKSEQITSGTLAYAVGSGKAVISTPYRYARELLDDGRGVLVPARDAGAIGREVVALLADPEKRHRLERRAAALGDEMAWPAVARRYVETFERARDEHAARRHATGRAKTLAHRLPAELPGLDLSHVRALTDDTGILQHATFNVPRYVDGYCVDDNARALLLATLVEEAAIEPPKMARALASRYLAFVSHAFDARDRRFRNFMTYDRRFRDEVGSEDCHGRALWALGAVVARSPDRSRQTLARDLFHVALPTTSRFTSPRAWAYTLLGVSEYLAAFEGESGVESLRATLTDKLVACFHAASTPSWPWFEDRLTYCNARLSQALILSGERKNQDEAKKIGLRSLDWLCAMQTSGGEFCPIGSNGFWVRGGERATFDQQPVEAASTISACLSAHAITGENVWMDRAQRAFQWFLGDNVLQTPLYDAATGGCRDGLHPDRANQNQGAESTLSFLVALLEMRAAAQAVRVGFAAGARSEVS
jgi:glycosyltransferase involved in cell wall biosynthesis